MLENIIVSSSPHISKPLSTRTIMLDVIVALIPAMAMAGWFFRIYAFILIATCVITALVTEWLCNIIRKKENSLDDFSAVITGIILAFSLPPKLPFWAAIIGTAFAIGIGKMVFGGLGANVFNPAMVGRTFLTACFGILMTTWNVPATIKTETPMQAITAATSKADGDIRTSATPLAYAKQVLKKKSDLTAEKLNHDLLRSSFIGERGGCLGETSGIALIIGGIYLIIRRTITFHIPLAVLTSTFLIAWIANLINPQTYVAPLFHLTTGGLLLCAFFIATDPVTAPLSKMGMWIFGFGIGALTMLIRLKGEYPEGVMYAVLLMNAVTPLIDRMCKLTPAGGKPQNA